ncbi:hypothetical protein Pint_15892 [Pistacia integerrima]|uniref:Uncharacterized protein n=1 Tax=Pistacia integerrima TaxID=434235 RepID=A0ACC0ZDZ6_9ROSI|nr:hypothetical protein Pint_15892 [Pistacia integerrima]
METPHRSLIGEILTSLPTLSQFRGCRSLME